MPVIGVTKHSRSGGYGVRNWRSAQALTLRPTYPTKISTATQNGGHEHQTSKDGFLMAQTDTPTTPAQATDIRFNTEEAAAYLGISSKTLIARRFYRKSPKYIKLGRLVFYRKSDLDDWVTDSIIDPEA